jgi:hypothetical protein
MSASASRYLLNLNFSEYPILSQQLEGIPGQPATLLNRPLYYLTSLSP